MRIIDWSSDVCSSDLQRVADEVDQRLIIYQPGIFGEDGRGFRVLDMRLKRYRSFNAQRFHQPGHEEDAVEKILLLVFRAFEYFLHTAQEGFQIRPAIADDQRADSSAADDQHLMRDSLHDWSDIAASDDETAKYRSEE